MKRGRRRDSESGSESDEESDSEYSESSSGTTSEDENDEDTYPKTGKLSHAEYKFIHDLQGQEKHLRELLKSTKFKEKHGFKSHGPGWVIKHIFKAMLLSIFVSIFGTILLSLPTAILGHVMIVARLVIVEAAYLLQKILDFVFKVWRFLATPIGYVVDAINIIVSALRAIGIPAKRVPDGFKKATIESVFPPGFVRFLDIPNVCKYYNNWRSVLVGIFYIFSAKWLCPWLRAMYAAPVTRHLAKAIYLFTDLMAPTDMGGRNCEANLSDADCVLLGTGFVLRDLVLPNVYLFAYLLIWWSLISWIIHVIVRKIAAFSHDLKYQTARAAKAESEQLKFEVSGRFATRREGRA